MFWPYIQLGVMLSTSNPSALEVETGKTPNLALVPVREPLLKRKIHLLVYMYTHIHTERKEERERERERESPSTRHTPCYKTKFNIRNKCLMEDYG